VSSVVQLFVVLRWLRFHMIQNTLMRVSILISL